VASSYDPRTLRRTGMDVGRSNPGKWPGSASFPTFTSRGSRVRSLEQARAEPDYSFSFCAAARVLATTSLPVKKRPPWAAETLAYSWARRSSIYNQ